MRISDDLRKCVVFFGTRVPANGIKSEPEIKYGGTGFLVHETTKSGVVIPYLVTARHVAERLDVDFVIRANLKDGGLEKIPVESTDWLYPEDPHVDLAVTPFSLAGQQYDHIYYPITDAQPPQEMVICGDPVAIVGLFRLRFGSARNIPIVHSGHVAALADPTEPIPSRNTSTGIVAPTVAHLIEAQTLEGLSGSPVFVQGFVYFSQFNIPNTGHCHPFAYGMSKLFGIHQGAWDGEPGTILAEDRGLGGKARVPVGMGLVTPAEELISLIQNHPDLKRKRLELEEIASSENAAVTDSAFDLAPSSDKNPTHLEDFNRLVDVAARKRPRDDQP